MDVEVWIVYLQLILIIIMLVLMKQNLDVEEARKKERKSKLSRPPPSSPSNVGKQLEYIQEELDKFLEKLNHVVFDTEARKRDGHHDQKSLHRRNTDVVSETKEHSGKESTRLDWAVGSRSGGDTHHGVIKREGERQLLLGFGSRLCTSPHPSATSVPGGKEGGRSAGTSDTDCTPLHLQLPVFHGDCRDKGQTLRAFSPLACRGKKLKRWGRAPCRTPCRADFLIKS